MKQDISDKQYKKLQRLYTLERNFKAGGRISLPEGQAHYLRHVMRASLGDLLRVFNGADGEWLAEIEILTKKEVGLVLRHVLRPQSSGADIWVLASPVKKGAFDDMVQKATELGASRIYPVICAHTVMRNINLERLQAIAIEAAEQCERLDVPELLPLSSLEDVLAAWPDDRKLIAAIERISAPAVIQALEPYRSNKFYAVLVGPEGGFSESEVERLREFQSCVPVSMGERILRADTALYAVLTCVQAKCGDWV